MGANGECLIFEPFVQREKGTFRHLLNGKCIGTGASDYPWLEKLHRSRELPPELPGPVRESLRRDGWLVEDSGLALGRRFRLRVANLEASTVCNQACDFCPVSVKRRDTHHMDMAMYAGIAAQLADYRSTLEAVYMIHYNEPTVDPRFLTQVATLRHHGLPVAINTNATGLSPVVADTLVAFGGIRCLSVNLSTLDKEKYRSQRGRDHLDKVLANLDHAARLPLAEEMDIAVLGHEDDAHEREHEAIRRRFAGTRFTVRAFPVMDRAGHLAGGKRPPAPPARLGGCDNLGSRAVEHVTVDARGDCVLCCQDYDGRHVFGNLSNSTLGDVLVSDAAARWRLMTHGYGEPAGDFLCRRCTFALSRS